MLISWSEGSSFSWRRICETTVRSKYFLNRSCNGGLPVSSAHHTYMMRSTDRDYYPLQSVCKIFLMPTLWATAREECLIATLYSVVVFKITISAHCEMLRATTIQQWWYKFYTFSNVFAFLVPLNCFSSQYKVFSKSSALFENAKKHKFSNRNFENFIIFGISNIQIFKFWTKISKLLWPRKHITPIAVSSFFVSR